MKIVIFGATGHIGRAILDESVRRRHTVSVVVRDASRLVLDHHCISVHAGDAADPSTYSNALQGSDAVIASLSARRDRDASSVPRNASTLLDAVARAGVPRFAWVGGAGSLETAPGVRVIDDPAFPAAWKPEAEAQAEALAVFRASSADVDWVYVSPAALLEDGERSGQYRLGADRLLVDAHGKSRITIPDFAIALLDRVEKNDRPRQRVSVAH
ncbi:MAG: NAD(P)H-binding protein [Rudaea sp.]